MTAIVDNHVDRTRLELPGNRAQLVPFRLVANERCESIIVERGEISEIDANHGAKRKIRLPKIDGRDFSLLAPLGRPATSTAALRATVHISLHSSGGCRYGCSYPC